MQSTVFGKPESGRKRREILGRVCLAALACMLALAGVEFLQPVVPMAQPAAPKRWTHERMRLYRNQNGKRFEDVTKAAGLDRAMAPMGSNFGDFDGDGFLDFYLGTGTPDYSMLVPNRMFKNVGGRRFADITFSSGTGHLQKGHGVACGDWDRNGSTACLRPKAMPSS